jgi:UPF0042 nucleotide-binding protein
MMRKQGRRLIIISGLSGAGKTVALNSLEDLDFYCIDNLPISLLNEISKQISNPSSKYSSKFAIGIDARNPEQDIDNLPSTIAALKEQGIKVDLVYLEANDDVLTSRFSETRRKHPLSSDKKTLPEAIVLERQIMEKLSLLADMRIDTSHTLMHQLRDIVRERIAELPLSSLSIQFTSFGYKHGVPRDADFVFDVRCLPNPYWEKHLRSLSGKDQPVIEFLSKQKLVLDMIKELQDFLKRWIPKFEADNRSYLCVAIGCTGGHHRSVYIAEILSKYFLQLNKHVILNHRDI